MTHAAVVVTAAAILDQTLERAIKTQLPGLTKALSKKIFEDFGPLHSFSAKIDMAHALGITNDLFILSLERYGRCGIIFRIPRSY
jgi:hypothetical protein